MMINKYLRKIIVLAISSISIIIMNPIGISAKWKQDNTGWWYTEGTSWAIGWRNIHGKWYYFNSDGYMVNDTTIDGYNIGSDGAWIENNVSTKENQNYNSDSFDINVSLKYTIHIDDKIKGTNPNIIKATRQAIFNADCDFAESNNYNGYTVNNDILIFNVIEKGTDIWEVDFYEKKSDENEYNKIGYSFAIVEKQKDGSYKGGMSHSSTAEATIVTGETN